MKSRKLVVKFTFCDPLHHFTKLEEGKVDVPDFFTCEEPVVAHEIDEAYDL